LILRPASDNAQFMRPVIVNRFPTPTANAGKNSPTSNIVPAKTAGSQTG